MSKNIFSCSLLLIVDCVMHTIVWPYAHLHVLPLGWDHFEPCEAGFDDLWDMYQLVTSQHGDAIIIDADDLVQHPGKTSI